MQIKLKMRLQVFDNIICDLDIEDLELFNYIDKLVTNPKSEVIYMKLAIIKLFCFSLLNKTSGFISCFCALTMLLSSYIWFYQKFFIWWQNPLIVLPESKKVAIFTQLRIHFNHI